MKARKTSGVVWLGHSMAEFNGSGYADRTSAELFLKSYLAYKWMKHDNYAINTVDKSYEGAMQIASKLMSAKPAGRRPTQKRLENFSKYYNHMNNSITNYPTTEQLNEQQEEIAREIKAKYL